jgi:chaperone modulatory protein CbpM
MSTLEELLRLHERLTVVHIEQWITRGLLRPQVPDDLPVREIEFAPVDVARVHLLWELHEELQFDDDALETVVRLIDQAQSLRRQLDTLGRAIASQPTDVQRAIAEAVRAAWERQR